MLYDVIRPRPADGGAGTGQDKAGRSGQRLCSTGQDRTPPAACYWRRQAVASHCGRFRADGGESGILRRNSHRRADLCNVFVSVGFRCFDGVKCELRYCDAQFQL